MKNQYSIDEKEKFSKAKELSRKNDLVGTLRIMQDLVQASPNSFIFRAALANTLWNLGDTEKALPEFHKAGVLDPLNEAVSLSIFHCLWGLNRNEEAFDEMKRFLAISDSKEYKSILEGLNEDSRQEE